MSAKDRTIMEYENKIALLTQEIERTNVLIEKRGAEIDNWRTKYSRLEQESEFGGREKIMEYESRITTITQELNVLREKYSYVVSYVVLLCAEIDALRIGENQAAEATYKAKRESVNLQNSMAENDSRRKSYSQIAQLEPSSFGGGSTTVTKRIVTTTQQSSMLK